MIIDNKEHKGALKLNYIYRRTQCPLRVVHYSVSVMWDPRSKRQREVVQLHHWVGLGWGVELEGFRCGHERTGCVPETKRSILPKAFDEKHVFQSFFSNVFLTDFYLGRISILAIIR